MARNPRHDQTSDSVEEEWLVDTEFDSDDEESSVIYKSSGINPSKRRRIEMMQEERELQKSLREVFDED